MKHRIRNRPTYQPLNQPTKTYSLPNNMPLIDGTIYLHFTSSEHPKMEQVLVTSASWLARRGGGVNASQGQLEAAGPKVSGREREKTFSPPFLHSEKNPCLQLARKSPTRRFDCGVPSFSHLKLNEDDQDRRRPRPRRVLVLCAATAVHGGTVDECAAAQASDANFTQCVTDKAAAAGTDVCATLKELYKCTRSTAASMSACCSGQALDAIKAAASLSGCTLTDADICPNSAESTADDLPAWLAEVASSGRFSDPRCAENRSMFDLVRGLREEPGLYVSGALGSLSEGAFGTWACIANHPCMQAVGAGRDDDRMCYAVEHRSDSDTVLHAWGLASQVRVDPTGCASNRRHK